jgi:sulfite reductase (NADPH) flavoprotein alpha-component
MSFDRRTLSTGRTDGIELTFTRRRLKLPNMRVPANRLHSLPHFLVGLAPSVSMLKKTLFQLHWFFGITAGLVLALMGATGALQSFQPEILRVLNPEIFGMPTTSGVAPLGPDALRERVLTDMPGRSLTALTLPSDPTSPARAVFAPPSAAAGPPTRRGELRWVDPYSGKVLPVPRGAGFFDTVRDVHRFLLAGDVGRRIVGACALILVFLSLSGLYLRWPRQLAQWRAWFSVRRAQRGRAFVWNLHATLGTFALVCYLLSALTGMWWSVDSYRSAVSTLLGVPPRPADPPPGQRPTPPTADAARQGRAGAAAAGRDSVRAAPTAPPLSLDTARDRIVAVAGPIGSMTFTLPARPELPLQVTYLDARAPHDRATNRATFDAAGGIALHERYADKPAGVRLAASVYPLHTGEFFGLPGRLVLMLSALGLPVFAVTGWMLYLDRRRKTRALRAARDVAADAADLGRIASPALLIAFASQSGTAEQLAWQTAHALQGAGVQVAVHPLAGLNVATLGGFRRALFVVSTFGDGEAPDTARRFARQVMSQRASLSDIGFGMLSLGDRSYAGFCGFGRRLHDWLTAHGARPLFDTVEVDNHDPAAIDAWQRNIGTLGPGDPTAWEHAPFAPWTILARERTNVGGAPLCHVVLAAPEGVSTSWQSGDLVDVMPHHPAATVDAWLRGRGFDPAAVAAAPGQTLAEALAASEWPHSLPADASRDELLTALEPLRPRQYSIASIPADGTVHLLVRARATVDAPGLASRLLTDTLPIGGTVSVRLRPHPAFRLGPDNWHRPLILIGNGSGLAGLMGHLSARIAEGQTRNWLVYGARHAADLPYRDRLMAWQEGGQLARLDLALSRDQPERVYVQHKLADASATLREWVERGAAIYVCGSLDGMAGGVDAVLHAVLGTELVDALVDAGRYRRDVY